MAFAEAIGTGTPVAVVADVDWDQVAKSAELDGGRFFSEIAEFAPTPPVDGSTLDDDRRPLPQRLATATGEEREQLLREQIRTELTEVLGRPVDDNANFLESGLTSLTALELTRRLTDSLSLDIPLITIIDKPTTNQLAAHLTTLLPPPAVGALTPA